MLEHWIIDLIGHLSGLTDAQLREIEKSLPATKALIDLLNRAQPIIEQAQSLYAEATKRVHLSSKKLQLIVPVWPRNRKQRWWRCGLSLRFSLWSCVHPSRRHHSGS